MGTFEIQLAILAGLELIKRLIKSDKDTSVLEAEIIAADTPQKVEAIAIREAVNAVTEATNKEVGAIIGALAEAKDKKHVLTAIAKPAIKKGILEGIGDFIDKIFSAVFGSKR